MKRRAKGMAGKAPDAYGFKPAHLLLLPDEAWDDIADAFMLMVERLGFTAALAAVRTVGIPKTDGGTRPISIAHLVWRLCTGELVALLSPWVDRWAPPELTGGLKGRSAAEIHAQII